MIEYRGSSKTSGLSPGRRPLFVPGFWLLSNPKSRHIAGEMARSGARRGGRARPGGAAGRGQAGRGQARRVEQIRQGVRPDHIRPFRPPRNRRQPFRTSLRSLRNHEQKKSYVNQAVDERFITGLSARPRALFISSCWPMDRRLFLSDLSCCKAYPRIEIFFDNKVSARLRF